MQRAMERNARERAGDRYEEIGAIKHQKIGYPVLDPTLKDDRRTQELRRLSDCHYDRAVKYERAADDPWLPCRRTRLRRSNGAYRCTSPE
jgi:hypothetical protein